MGSETAHGKRRQATADREQLVVTNLPLVRSIAIQFHKRLPQHVDLNDLVSAGILGLVEACSKYDPVRNPGFNSYAQYRIRGAMLDSLRTGDWASRKQRRDGRAIELCISKLTSRLRRAPSESEIAHELGMPLGEYQQLLGTLAGLEIGTLHARYSEDGEEELAYIASPAQDDPLFRCLTTEMKRRIASAIDELPEKERIVLTLYYYEELKMQEIATVLSVNPSRVSQLHSSAVLRLRARLADWSQSKRSKLPV